MACAREVLLKLTPGDGATLICLQGELGAGKTVFTRGMARALGVNEHITSPTFVLEKIYQLGKGETFPDTFARLVHIDAYRLEGGKELTPLLFDELCQDSKNLILLEWPENVKDALPEGALLIKIEHTKEGGRKILLAI